MNNRLAAILKTRPLEEDSKNLTLRSIGQTTLTMFRKIFKANDNSLDSSLLKRILHGRAWFAHSTMLLFRLFNLV